MPDSLANAPWRMRLDAATHACVQWRPTTLRACGRNERFLEDIIAANPAMLGLEDRRAQVRGPYVAFHQRPLDTPQSRSVKPDLMFLTESGHVIVVEVKLCDNGELGDRRAVAQLLDYASSLAGYEEDDLAELFDARAGESFAGLVRRLLPQAVNHVELAGVLRERIQNAEIHLVIACDGAPEGLREFVRGVARQSALGAFELRVVEIVPHVADAAPQELLLVPCSPLRTEIVARTAVNITYEEGQPKPGVSVSVTSPDEVEEAIRQARSGSEMRPHLAAVVQSYDAMAEPGLQTRGRAGHYRQIKPAGWPGSIHYEFLAYASGDVCVDLHLESEIVRPLGGTLESLAGSVADALPGVAWDPNWNGKRGRITRRFTAESQPATVARAMKDLIAGTRAQVDAALAKLGETAT